MYLQPCSLSKISKLGVSFTEPAVGSDGVEECPILEKSSGTNEFSNPGVSLTKPVVGSDGVEVCSILEKLA